MRSSGSAFAHWGEGRAHFGSSRPSGVQNWVREWCPLRADVVERIVYWYKCVVQRVLDLDLDAFIYGRADSRLRDQPRLDPDDYPPWEPEKLDDFLRNQCLLDRPLPGLAVDHDAEVFRAWREAIEADVLEEKFEVTHVDAHSDLAFFDTGRRYLRHELLSWPVEARRYPEKVSTRSTTATTWPSPSPTGGSHPIEYVIGGTREWDDGGHGILPIGGHRNSPRAAANSPHWRPRISPPVLS